MQDTDTTRGLQEWAWDSSRACVYTLWQIALVTRGTADAVHEPVTWRTKTLLWTPGACRLQRRLPTLTVSVLCGGLLCRNHALLSAALPIALGVALSATVLPQRLAAQANRFGPMAAASMIVLTVRRRMSRRKIGLGCCRVGRWSGRRVSETRDPNVFYLTVRAQDRGQRGCGGGRRP